MRNHCLNRVVNLTLRRLSVVALATGFAMGASAVAHATELFMNFPGVVGDATDTTHAKQVVLNGFSAADTLNLATTGVGRTTGRPVCGQVTVTKLIDRASPQLLGLMFTGRVTAGPVTIYFSNPTDGGTMDYYQIALDNVIVDSITQTDSTSDIVKESVQMHATKFMWTFNAQSADGSVTPIKFGWDCTLNRAL